MEIRQLVTFLAVIEQQSFSKAADLLGYTQAAVTIQIQQLEKEFHTRFFDRVGRHPTLTPPGEQFAKYAREKKGKLALLNVGEVKLDMYIQLLYHKNKWVNEEMQTAVRLLRAESIR